MMKRQKKITKYSNIGKLQDGTSYGLDETQVIEFVKSTVLYELEKNGFNIVIFNFNW